jgi:hypothetical protein
MLWASPSSTPARAGGGVAAPLKLGFVLMLVLLGVYTPGAAGAPAGGGAVDGGISP